MIAESPTEAEEEDLVNEGTKAKIEMVEYLYLDEPTNLKADPFKYWNSQKDKRPHLDRLVTKFHSAPAGSHESERLFSTAGHIVNDLRKSLTHHNLKKLLFLHHNLPLYNFKYSK